MTEQKSKPNEPHDQFIKQFVPAVLKNSFQTETSVSVQLSEELAIDVLCRAISPEVIIEPDPNLGLLGRLVAVHPTIIIEHYSGVSHDGKTLVTGGNEGQVKIWRAAIDADRLGWADFTGKQWYEILSVDINANRQEVKRAYIRLARKYHPDINQFHEAKSQMQAINRDYAKFHQNISGSQAS